MPGVSNADATGSRPHHVSLLGAMRPDDLDPLGLGLLPALKCKACQRDRYKEYMDAPAADVIQRDGDSEIVGVPCACGATLIEHGWFGDGPNAGSDYT